MRRKELSVERYGEVSQHVENILHCGLCTYNYQTQELFLSKGIIISSIFPKTFRP
mgnify:CR=1 FL=1